MIKIKAPRYRDRVVLIARYKLTAGRDAEVEIMSGAYAGTYKIKNSDIVASPIELMRTRNGSSIQMRAVSLDKLERKEN